MTTPLTAPAGSGGFKIEPLNYLLLALPAAIILKFSGAGSVVTFVVSGIAIIPLAGLMGRATENLAETMGAGIGGLLNATFGNAAELIIALIALSRAHDDPKMIELVKASLTGSIIGNVLLVLGLSIMAGGIYYKKQHFNRTAASMGATLLTLAAAGLLLPTLHRSLSGKDQAVLSEEIAIVLIVTYVLSLVFSLRTHSHLFAGPEEELPTTGERHEPEWSRRTSLIVLLAATVGVAVASEILIGSVEQAAESLGMPHVFIGVIVVAIVGNAAEHSTAVLVAMKNKMDLSVNIAVGSSLQIALFVAPVLVFASLLMGHSPPLDLDFTLMEVAAVVISILVLSMIAQDGETHWMEGVMLLALYVMLAMAFYHLPEGH